MELLSSQVNSNDSTAIVKKVLFEDSPSGKVVVIDDEEFHITSEVSSVEQLSQFLQLQNAFKNLKVIQNNILNHTSILENFRQFSLFEKF